MRKKFSLTAAILIISICILLLVYFPTQALSAIRAPKSSTRMIRIVTAQPDQVTLIHTAMGYSTILEFDGKPLNAVLGDQDSFKTEFIGNSITIKPLFPHARSNLFVFTEFERFNFQLQSGPPELVDYIVTLKRKEVAPESSAQDKSSLFTRAVRRFIKMSGFELNVISTAKSSSRDSDNSVTLIEIELSSSKTPYFFSPQSLGIKQGNRYLPIESVYLDTLTLQPGAPPVHGKIAVLDQDMTSKLPLSVVFAVSDPKRKSKTLRLEVIAEPKGKKPVTAKKVSDPFYGIIPIANQKH